MIAWEDFEKVELRAGTIVRVEDFTEAKKPAYQLWVDLGEEIGIRSSSAQITRLYRKEALVGRQVVCVTNLPPKRVANFVSEVLVTGFILAGGDVVLIGPESQVPNGSRLG
ncbi:MAG: tRNA-binding protein [Ferruginibacter sp.]|nr:tRNA-binding protein [Cytophagales bacterium]